MMATAEMPVIPRFSVMGSDGHDRHESGLLRTFCGLAMTHDDEPVWLTYAEAARRVKSSTRTVKRWRRTGMPMEWRLDAAGNQIERVVEEQVLLSWWRDRLKASPVHFYKMRRAAIERGETPPPLPDRFKRGPQTENPTTVRNATDGDLTASDASAAPDSQDGDIGRTDPYTELLASLPEFVGQREHAALIAAMEHETPACDGLEVFTRDRFDDPEEIEMMRGICRECPLIELCAAFAAAGKPSAGMWAGMTPVEVRRSSFSSSRAATLPRSRVPDPTDTRAQTSAA